MNHTPEKNSGSAADQECHKCHKRRHYARVCRTTLRVHNTMSLVRPAVEYVTLNHIHKVDTTKAEVTFRINGKKDLAFQIDTGAACNVISAQDYVLAIADRKFKEVAPTNVILVMHNKNSSTCKGVGLVDHRKEWTGIQANFIVVPGTVTPLLSLTSSQQMGLVKIMDCDTVTSQSSSTPKGQNDRLTVEHTDEILRRCIDVFENLGCPREEYSIELHKEATPLVNPPRKMPAPLREAVRNSKELDRLTKEGITAQVTEPTEWVSSMVTV